MSVRTKMLGFVDVILRVPPIFIIDEILKISMGLPFATQNDSTVLESNSQITTISGSAGVPTDSMLFNDNSSSSTISSSNFSSNSSSSLEQFLNTSSAELFGDAMSAAANSAAAADDTEFYKIVSLTSLKFLSCLLGKCLECVCICAYVVEYECVLQSQQKRMLVTTFNVHAVRSPSLSLKSKFFPRLIIAMCSPMLQVKL